MRGRVRTLGGHDLGRALEYLEESEAENLFLTAKLDEFGIDRRRLGRLLAYLDADGEIAGMCLDGGTLFVTGTDPNALPAFVDEIGGFRRASSIVGPSFAALGVFLGLCERHGERWSSCTNVRRRQPLMVLDQPIDIDGDPRVELLTEEHFQSYLDASVDMYTVEIGSSPFKYGPGYETFVLQRLRQRDAYGIVVDGEVIFKADLGPRHRSQVQLQGVWVQPELRGQGLAVPALAAMLRQVQRRFRRVSLYVNDFNAPALRSYERLGFETIGSLSTVHY